MATSMPNPVRGTLEKKEHQGSASTPPHGHINTNYCELSTRHGRLEQGSGRGGKKISNLDFR
eukprot:scaffold273328_cov19-Tisochrysis_lutea.AAC.1